MEKVIRIPSIQSIALGAIVMAIGGIIRVPCYPVPFTLQTLAVFLLGLSLPPKEALAAGVSYFLMATLINPLWLAGPTAGYIVSFPLAAFMISYFSTRLRPLYSLLIGQGVIYLIGYTWLAALIGPKVALHKGIVLFLPAATIKISMALVARRWVLR